MQYNPKLKKAMEEIKNILDKHDIAASIALHSPGHTEYLMKVDPSYSCAFFDNGPGSKGIRVRTRLQQDFGGDVAKRHQSHEDTVNLFNNLATVVGGQALQLYGVLDMLEKKFEITRTGGGHTSHDAQNN